MLDTLYEIITNSLFVALYNSPIFWIIVICSVLVAKFAPFATVFLSNVFFIKIKTSALIMKLIFLVMNVALIGLIAKLYLFS